ncbi:histidine phosphatase family protein [Phycicoccus jejuensis]|uniref:histidine phosphatase family protein n=2 Tax=Phycicoccus jejuensis TaxID=367299 RepID=UPI000A06BE17|nr:histidine phosphatase family protein [Phycicoccus jejuensis]
MPDRPPGPPSTEGWPSELVLVRHGQSVGNLAAEAAGSHGVDRLDLEHRDPDTPLSDTGEVQARALGRHLATWPTERLPEVVIASPYTRAAATADHALADVSAVPAPVHDERVRERDLGLFDGLTSSGIRELHPDEARRRESMGKFYYRPPGGESWVDVVLRVRGLLRDVRSDCADRRVWVFTHQAVIMAFRYVLEGLTEQDLLGIDRDTPLANCSLTTYRSGEGGLELTGYGAVEHLERPGGARTTHSAPTPAGTGDGPADGGDHDA